MDNVFNNKIIILDNVLTYEECDKLIQYYRPTKEWDGTYPMFLEPGNLIDSCINKIECAINEILPKKIMVDWCEIVRWPINSYKGLHYDNASNETIFTSITYLNDNYDGGETYIKNDLKVIPKIGRTVFFDGQFYEHGVTQITGNDRYTIPIWYKLTNPK